MRIHAALLIVSTFAASIAACGTPVSVGTDTGTVTTSAPQTGTQSDPVAAGGQESAPGTSGTTQTPATPSTGSTGLCGTTATAITYSGQAQAVIAANCTLCHNVTAPVMTDYDSSRSGFENGGAQAVANGVMPISITLSDNDKCILTQWANNNYAK